VHGAGSFGHHQAKQYQVHRGIYKDDSISKAELFKGFCLTRESVCKLSSAVLDSLNKEGVLATGCKAFPAWETATVYDQNHSKTVNVIKHNAQEIAKVVNSGIIPVIHGDCVFDSEQACSILSGDLILETLATELQVKQVVFLSDVAGILTAPPSKPNSALISEIIVKKSGKFDMPQTSVLDIDVTGGIEGKLKTAARIANKGIKVFFANSSSESAIQACLGTIFI